MANTTQRPELRPEHKVMYKTLRKHWDAAKGQLGRAITQTGAAEHLQIKQSTVCQYLTGVIPLNHQIVLKFVQYFKEKGYTDIDPGLIDPNLGKLIQYHPKVFVLATLDRTAPTVNFVPAPSLDSSINHYGIQLDEKTVAIVSPTDKITKRTKVCASLKNKHIVGLLVEKTDTSISIKTPTDIQTISTSKIVTLHRVVDTQKIP